QPLSVPSTVVLPRRGSFSLTDFGRTTNVQASALLDAAGRNSFALKRDFFAAFNVRDSRRNARSVQASLRLHFVAVARHRDNGAHCPPRSATSDHHCLPNSGDASPTCSRKRERNCSTLCPRSAKRNWTRCQSGCASPSDNSEATIDIYATSPSRSNKKAGCPCSPSSYV